MKIKKSIKLFFLLGILQGIFSPATAQTYDIKIINKKISSDSTLEFDVTIVNNNQSNAWGLRAFQCGYKFDPVFVNGGSLSCQYLNGTSELDSIFIKNWAFSWSNSVQIINQSSNVGNSCPGSIIDSVEKRIGRFRVTNSKKWGCGPDDITVMTKRKGSHLTLNVTRYGDTLCTTATPPKDITAGATITYASKKTNETISACQEFFWNNRLLTESGIYYYDPTGCPLHKDTLILALDTANRWTGGNSRSWNDPSNWSCGKVPDSTSVVLIPAEPANQPEIIGYEAFCRRIHISTGASIRIGNNGKLNSSGNKE